MLDVIKYILDTEQDIKLYFEPDILVHQLKLRFSYMDILNSFIWFKGFVDFRLNMNYRNTKSFRYFDEYEYTFLSKNLINKIIKSEMDGLINCTQRDLIVNKIIVLIKSCIFVDENVLDSLIDKIIVHIQKYELINLQKYLNVLPINCSCSLLKH
jgi:uncharacterized protein Smg (DUF494 family)